MQFSCPHISISSESASAEEIVHFNQELVAKLRQSGLVAEVNQNRGPIREKGFESAAGILIEFVAEQALRETIRRFVSVVIDFVQENANLKINFSQSEKIFGSNPPGVEIDINALAQGERDLLEKIVLTFGKANKLNDNRIALVAGVNAYNDPTIENLKYSVTDAARVENALGKASENGFMNVRKLENPGKQELAKQIESLLNNATEQDIVFFYFSGHGLVGPGNKLFLACKDSEQQNIVSTGLPISLITECLSTSKCKKFVALLDCCYAARADEEVASALAKADMQTEEVSGQYWLYASEEKTTENDHLGSSTVTKYFCEGLEQGKADLNQDGEISIEEVENYIKDCTEDIDAKSITSRKINTTGKEIIIAYNKKAILQREHKENILVIQDLYSNNIISKEHKNEWTTYSQSYSESKKDETSLAEKELWAVLRNLAENKLVTGDAIVRWYEILSRQKFQAQHKTHKREKTYWMTASIVASVLLGAATVASGGPISLFARPATDEQLSTSVKVQGPGVIEQTTTDTEAAHIKVLSTSLEEAKEDLERSLQQQRYNHEVIGNLRESLRTHAEKITKLRTQLAEAGNDEWDQSAIDREISTLRAGVERRDLTIRDLRKTNAALQEALNEKSIEARTGALAQEGQQKETLELKTYISLGPASLDPEKEDVNIRLLQNALYEKGCYAGYVDGDAGSGTVSAVATSVNAEAGSALSAARPVVSAQNEVAARILAGEYGEFSICSADQIDPPTVHASRLQRRGMVRLRGRYHIESGWAEIDFQSFASSRYRLSLADNIGTVEEVYLVYESGQSYKLSSSKSWFHYDFPDSRNFSLRLKKRKDDRGSEFGQDFSITATLIRKR